MYTKRTLVSFLGKSGSLLMHSILLIKLLHTYYKFIIIINWNIKDITYNWIICNKIKKKHKLEACKDTMSLKKVHHLHYGAWIIMASISLNTMNPNSVGSTISLFQHSNKCLNSMTLKLKAWEYLFERKD